MTDPRHHPNPSLLWAHAAGLLSEAFDLIVASHVSLCDDCRAWLGAADAVGGELLERGSVPVADDLLDRTLQGLDRTSRAQAPVPAGEGVLPAPLRDYVGGDLDAVRWRPVGMGVRQAVLKTTGPAKARLLQIPAGAAMPEHSHRGTELTLVLRGAFSDAAGRFGRGDLEAADDTLEHVPTAEAGEDCICLTATEAPLRFRGVLPRLAQRFIGI